MIKSIVSVSLIFASTYLYADETQSLEAIKNKIERHILNELTSYSEGKIQVVADRLDPRLNLKPCADDQLTVFNPYQTPMLNSTTMGIKCKEDSNHWTVYVPVRISLLKTIYVAKNAMLKGTKVKAEDIYQTELDVHKLKQGYFTDSNVLIGQVCKQNVSPDTPLTPYNIELAKLIHKGETVTISAANAGLSISMEGIALGEGALGEAVKVKNLSSKRIIEAQVSGRKKVKVVM